MICSCVGQVRGCGSSVPASLDDRGEGLWAGPSSGGLNPEQPGKIAGTSGEPVSVCDRVELTSCRLLVRDELLGTSVGGRDAFGLMSFDVHAY